MQRFSIFRSFLFALVLLGAPGWAAAQSVVRGPYLQTGTPNSVIVKWRTDSATDSVVYFGTSQGNLIQSSSASGDVSDHEVEVSGLAPDTRYFYAVGTSARILAGNDSSYFFTTSPAPGEARPMRIWVLGDPGTAGSRARSVRDAFIAYTGSRKPDLMLMLGDNAYTDGTDFEHQAAVFDMYPMYLKNTVLWSTLGNHEGHTADSASQSGPYYDIFTLPKKAEAGGVASGTEAYYSFDYGNVHFICLDSYETDTAPGGAMMSWMRADLQANDKPWVVAFWHHPPYSRGTHDGDPRMRENVVPILEQYGVDLVLSGHSHVYERSYLIDGHYGLPSTFTEAMKVDPGDGNEAGDGAYRKALAKAGPHEGAVYVVEGASGAVGDAPLDHPAMAVSRGGLLGSVVLDIDGRRLDGRRIDNNGNLVDHFTLLKGADTIATDTGTTDTGTTDTGATDTGTTDTGTTDTGTTDTGTTDTGATDTGATDTGATDTGSYTVDGAIPGDYPLYSVKKMEIRDDVTINKNTVAKGSDEYYAAVTADGTWKTASLALPKLPFESYPKNPSSTDADAGDSPFTSDSAVFYDQIEVGRYKSVRFRGNGPFHIKTLKLKRRATVDLGTGIFYIDDLEMREDDATIHAGNAVVYLGDKFDADAKGLNINSGRWGTITGLRIVLAKDAEFKLKGEDKGDEANLTALIYGPDNEKVELEKAIFRGAIVTKGEIKLNKVNMTYTPDDQAAVATVKP